MVDYFIRRILMIIPTLVGITLVSFLILQLVPGDPARTIAGMDAEEKDVEVLRRQLGLDKPIFIQYEVFLVNAARGNFGRSIRTQNEVLAEIWPRLLNSFRLAMVSIIIAFIIGTFLGTLAAAHQNTTVDHVTMGIVLLGVSTPTFWSGLVIILIFSVYLGWFPSGGYAGFKSFVLPVITLAAPSIAMTARMARSSMLEVLRQDYIKAARAKGLRESKIVYKHAPQERLGPDCYYGWASVWLPHGWGCYRGNNLHMARTGAIDCYLYLHEGLSDHAERGILLFLLLASYSSISFWM